MEYSKNATADDSARRTVAEASKVLGFAGQSDMIWGHVSVRDPGGRGVWMKAAGWGLEEVDEGRVVLVGDDGSVLEGAGRRHIEYPIHTAIMRLRSDVGCVIHTHASSSTAFAALGVPLRPVSHDATLFVPPDIVRFSGTSGLISSDELGLQLAAELGERNAILIPGHGVAVVGVDAPTAVMTAVLLDRACGMQIGLEAAGGPQVWTADDEALEKRASCWAPSQIQAGWAYLLRRSGAA